MQEASKMLSHALGRYAEALNDGRYDEAIQIAAHLPLNGDLAIIHPDFLEKFRAACPDADPRQTLERAGQLLSCVAEAARGARPRPREPIIKTS